MITRLASFFEGKYKITFPSSLEGPASFTSGTIDGFPYFSNVGHGSPVFGSDILLVLRFIHNPNYVSSPLSFSLHSLLTDHPLLFTCKIHDTVICYLLNPISTFI